MAATAPQHPHDLAKPAFRKGGEVQRARVTDGSLVLGVEDYATLLSGQNAQLLASAAGSGEDLTNAKKVFLVYVATGTVSLTATVQKLMGEDGSGNKIWADIDEEAMSSATTSSVVELPPGVYRAYVGTYSSGTVSIYATIEQ